MSPWNKDRSPVHPKNTCEFDFKIQAAPELSAKCLWLLYSFRGVTCSSAGFNLFPMQQILLSFMSYSDL